MKTIRTVGTTLGFLMRAWPLVRVVMTLLLLVSWDATSAQGDDHGLRGPRPLAFEANRGQTDAQVKFLARGSAYTVFLTSTEAVLMLGDGPGERVVVRLKPIGANAAARILPDGELPGVVNYSRGAPATAPISAPTYAAVRYADVYPGVDLVYYGRPRRLEYDFVVAPGADPGQIALRFEGVEGVELDAGGDLVVRTAAGELRQPRPVVYQAIDGARRPVVGDYWLDSEGRVRLRLGAYDTSHPLVIDPVLSYSTYLGGSDDEADWLLGSVVGIALDPAGNAYVVGTTRSPDFPTTPGRDQTLGGDQDVFVTKLSPTGAALYSTYLGGPCDDIGRNIAVDAAGNAYITGRANAGFCSMEFQPGVLVAKLDSTGAVLYAVVFGGSLADTSIGQAIAVDADGHAYVTGLAQSSSQDFPTTPGAYQTHECADVWSRGDGFVAKLSADGASLMYSTFLCGSGHDSPNGIAIDTAGNAYIAGSTGSGDFPTVNALQPSPGGGPDVSGFGATGFVSKLSPDGSRLIYSTYLGGSAWDVIQGLAIDGQGNVYVTGETLSVDFPTTPGVLQEHAGYRLCVPQQCTDAFVTKIDPSGSAIVYSTYLFGELDEGGSRIAVDAAGNAYVVGTTASQYFPILDAFQPARAGIFDAFVAKLSPDGTRLVYSSYLGGSHTGSDLVLGWTGGSAIAVDRAGNAWVVGSTLTDDFPTTPGAFQPNFGGGICDFIGSPCHDAFVVKITAGGPGIVPPVSLSVTPAEVAAGGTLAATWAGLSPPTASDQLRLFTLGSPAGGADAVASWSTGGTAGGILSPTVPAGLPSGTYELRLMTPDPNFDTQLIVVARSQPIRVTAASPDLVVASIELTPSQPAAGQAVAVTVTVTNQGAAAVEGFVVDFYKDRDAAPGPGIVGDVRCPIAALAPATSVQCSGNVTYAATGTFTAWAQVDTGQTAPESNESNNVSGPRTVTVVPPSPGLPDLAVTSVTNPPASAAPGNQFLVTDTVTNLGTTLAGASTTRYYLALETTRTAADTLLTGVRNVPALVPGAQSASLALVAIPSDTAPGTYHLIACADDNAAVAESNDGNNCLASTALVTVARPDLKERRVSNPGGPFRPGSSFTVSDSVVNRSPVGTGTSSKTRYYLSLDGAKGPGDTRLVGGRTVPSLGPFGESSGAATVTIPVGTAPGTYVLLGCADDKKAMTEAKEGNNCHASDTPIVVNP